MVTNNILVSSENSHRRVLTLSLDGDIDGKYTLDCSFRAKERTEKQS
jgi:hypothetical protein